MLEKTHNRHDWIVEDLSQAQAAWSLALKIESRLPEWAKCGWRWRLLLIRSAIDHELESGSRRGVLEDLAHELSGIYHADDTFIGPPQLPERQETKGGKWRVGSSD